MKEKKLTAKNLIEAGTLILWSILGVIVVAGIRTLFYRLKIDWLTAGGAVGVPVITWIWGWAKQQIDTVAKTAEENRKQIALKFESLTNRMDRLTIEQQSDASIREQLVEQQIEIERIKTEIHLSERLRFVEQVIHRFIDQ